MVIRAPNHLGDLILSLPALEAAGRADIQVARGLLALLEIVRPGRRLLPLDRGARGLAAAASALRAGRYRRGILLTPSFSSALVFAAGGVGERRGTATDGRAILLTDAVAPARLAGAHRAAAYLSLVTGEPPGPPPAPRLEVPVEAQRRWSELLPATEAPLVGICPGSQASSRRWEPERFAEVGRRLAAEGARVVVFGGAGERPLTAAVAGDRGVDLGGRTDLPALAAGLAACALVVSNDSGPLHLAAAVGTPTVSLWGAGDPRVTGPCGPGHTLLRHAALACVPCVMNRCPRRGPGDILAQAERECLHLIGVDDVLTAVHVHRDRRP